MKQNLASVARGKLLDRLAVGVAQRRRPGAPGPGIGVGGEPIRMQRLEARVLLQNVAAGVAKCGEVARKRVWTSRTVADEIIERPPDFPSKFSAPLEIPGYSSADEVPCLIPQFPRDNYSEYELMACLAAIDFPILESSGARKRLLRRSRADLSTGRGPAP